MEETNKKAAALVNDKNTVKSKEEFLQKELELEEERLQQLKNEKANLAKLEKNIEKELQAEKKEFEKEKKATDKELAALRKEEERLEKLEL